MTKTKKTLQGKVVSTKMQKTVVVEINRVKKHPVYSKVIHSTKRIKAHDDIGVKENDMVIIQESRPFSKQVSWQVLEVLK